MKELWSLARDASVAVGAYVGMVRDRFWAELSNGDGFDERVARAQAEFAAHRLNEHEAENDGLEAGTGPNDIWAAEARAEGKRYAATFFNGFPHMQDNDSSSRQSAQGAVEEPRVATGPPHGTPGRSSNQPPVPPSGHSNLGIERDDPLAKAIQDSVTKPDSRIACIVDGEVYHLYKVHTRDGVMTTEWLSPMDWQKWLLPVVRPDTRR